MAEGRLPAKVVPIAPSDVHHLASVHYASRNGDIAMRPREFDSTVSVTPTRTSRQKLRNAVDAFAALAMIVAAVFIVVSSARGSAAPAAGVIRDPTRTKLPPPATPVNVADAMVQGSPTAHVAIVEYSDFQCPFCGRFARDTLPSLEMKYIKSGDVRLFFVHRPLPMHSQAEKAAEADVCAARQGKGWEMHDALFGDQKHLDVASLIGRADTLKLDRHSFERCLSSEAAKQVQGDVGDATTLQITSTPTFFVGTIGTDGRVKVTSRIAGAASEADLGKAIDPLVATTKK